MGPWGEPELLVWRPEAVASEPPVPVGLEVKLGALLLLLLLTLMCSLVPICVLRRPGANPEASGEPILFPDATDAWGGKALRLGRRPKEGKARVTIAWVGIVGPGGGSFTHSPLCSTPA